MSKSKAVQAHEDRLRDTLRELYLMASKALDLHLVAAGQADHAPEVRSELERAAGSAQAALTHVDKAMTLAGIEAKGNPAGYFNLEGIPGAE